MSDDVIRSRVGGFREPIASKPLAFWGAILLGVVASTAFFWNGVVSLIDAWGQPEYSHGPLIPVISAFLLFRQLRDTKMADGPITDRWPGVVLCVLALLLAGIGNITQIPDLVTYGLIAWVGALLRARYGWRRGRVLWPPVLHLVFMLPLPVFVAWQFSLFLQFISSEIGVALIQLMNVPVYLDGNIIDLGVYKLHVAEACSGLRYLFPILSFSYIFAILYQGPMWHKAVLLLSAAPIAILMNSLRIGIIGYMVNSYGIEHAEGFLHLFEGWVIFGLCILALLGLAWGLNKLRRRKESLAQALDLDFDDLQPQVARLFNVAPSRALTTCLVLVTAAAALWQLTPRADAANVDRDPLALYPVVMDGWSSSPQQTLAPGIERILGADDYRAVHFSHPDEPASVDFFVAYYDKLAGGAGIHSPEICLPAGGWEMSAIAQQNIELESGLAFAVNRAVIQKGLEKKLVYYWFEQRGRRLTSDYTAKAYTVIDALTRGRTDGALVRVITSILPGETEAVADARLKRMLEPTMEVLPRFVPG